jgi:hypothetical protein
MDLCNLSNYDTETTVYLTAYLTGNRSTDTIYFYRNRYITLNGGTRTLIVPFRSLYDLRVEYPIGPPMELGGSVPFTNT